MMSGETHISTDGIEDLRNDDPQTPIPQHERPYTGRDGYLIKDFTCGCNRFDEDSLPVTDRIGNGAQVGHRQRQALGKGS